MNANARGMLRTFSLGLAACASLLASCGGGGGAGVEETFANTGPAQVMLARATDASGLEHVIYYPAAQEGEARRALLAYGNGTFGICTEARSQLAANHLASWGFVVVCPETQFSYSGEEMLASLNFMLAEDRRDGSVFKGRIDAAKIGTIGNSQGATGALNANALSQGLVKSSVALALVDPALGGTPRLAEIRGTVLLASGCADPQVTQQEQDNYVNALPGPAARACAQGTDHLATVPASLGYATAWFMYTLRGDAFPRSAFVDSALEPAEMARNARWTGWRSKRLP